MMLNISVISASRKSLGSRSEQQLAFLRERQGEFKQAALNAKKNHDLELAKKYVRMMKVILVINRKYINPILLLLA